MNRLVRRGLQLSCLGAFYFILVGCGGADSAPTDQSTGSAEIESAAGQLNSVLDSKQLMNWILEPAADVVWDSAGYIDSLEGVEDLAPTTEEGWNHVRNNAAVVIESGNLLKMPGRLIADGDWAEFSQGLIDVGLTVKAAADAQDADALFEAGAHLYNVCLGCHQKYAPGL